MMLIALAHITSSFRRLLLAISLLVLAGPLVAQQPLAQHDAMKKLAFLEGRWSGPLTVKRGSEESLQLTQTEDVEFKLGGLVLLIQGASHHPDGATSFEALATIAYDDASKTYRFRAYNAGHYLDTEVIVASNGFSWSYDSGSAHITNTMHLTPKGEWAETTEVVVGSKPAMRSVEMLLQHQS